MVSFCTSIAPVRKSIFVTLPPSVLDGNLNKLEFAENDCPSPVCAEHCTSNASVLGVSPDSENGISNADALSGTEADATFWPLIETETSKDDEELPLELMGDVFAI